MMAEDLAKGLKNRGERRVAADDAHGDENRTFR
jgi:hypothetical protein